VREAMNAIQIKLTRETKSQRVYDLNNTVYESIEEIKKKFNIDFILRDEVCIKIGRKGYIFRMVEAPITVEDLKEHRKRNEN
jgi:hypothetical protein